MMASSSMVVLANGTFIPGWLGLGCFILFFAGAIREFAKFDGLLRRLVEEYPEEWQRLGSPIGFFWVPPGRRNLKGTLGGSTARSRVYYSWYANSPPEWIRVEDAVTLKCWRKLRSSRRISIACASVVALSALAYLLYFLNRPVVI